MRFLYVAASALSLAALFPNVGAAQGLQFIPVTPCRVADTRNPNGAFGGPEMTANSTRTFNIPSSGCGIPASAAAYALNVTVVPDAQLNFLTIWPTGQTQPLASTLNSDGRVKANAAIVPAGNPGGGVNVFVTDPTQVIIDINGYFVPDGTPNALQFYPLTPCRIADTRSQTGPLAGPFIPAGGTRQFPILSSNCGIPANASAYSLNFTAVPHGPLQFITVWPSDQGQPLASTLNASTGAVTANAAIVPGAAGSGQVSVFAQNDTDLVIDVNGYYGPGGGGFDFFNLTPCRVLDTRNNGGQPFNGIKPVSVTASGCNAPGAARAFVLNATVVPPGPLGYLTLWPDGQQQPFVSTLNALDAAITSNMAIVPTTNGSIDAFTSDPSHLILDISGYFGLQSTPPPPACAFSNGQPVPPCITVDSAAVGNNLQTLITVNLLPTPSVDTVVTVSTNDSTVAIAGNGTQVGANSYTYTQPAGTSSTALFVQGLASSGTATVYATAAGYNNDVPGTIMLFPSAFVLASPGGIGANFSTGFFGSATFTVRSARLDGSGNVAAIQQVKGMMVGNNPPPSVPTVSLTVDSGLGSVSPSSLPFSGGTDTLQTQFTAGNTMMTGSVTINEPGGFSIPANGANRVTVTVADSGLFCQGNVAVGFDLATQVSCNITGLAPVDETITLTSNNPSALLLAPKVSTPATSNITLTMLQGTGSVTFYLVGAANSGTASYSAVSALGNFTATVSLSPSGFVLNGGPGVGANFLVLFPGPDTFISVIPVLLDGSGNPLLQLPLAAGVSASVNVSSNNSSVGTISGSPVTLNGGDTSAVVTFHPTGTGTATLSASAAGFTTPASGASVGAIVQKASILIAPLGLPVGQNLELQNTVILTGTSSSNLTLTLSATGSIKLSANGTDAGATSVNITVPPGQNSVTYYIYGQASSGTAMVTASIPGFTSATTNVGLGASGFIITGPFGVAPVFQTPLGAGPQQLMVQPAVLDSSNNYIAMENLAGSKGAVGVTITNPNPSAGSVPSSVSVPVGGPGSVTFTPAQSGQQTVLTLGQPSGFIAPAPSSTSPQGNLTVSVQ